MHNEVINVLEMDNRFFRLPLNFDQKRLLSDLATCQRQPWISHYNQADYAGNWSILALRSITGSATDIRSLNDQAGYQDTPLLHQCPYFYEIITAFACEKESIRLMLLAPGASIKTHRDIGTNYANGMFRIHIPIQTSDTVSFVVDNEPVRMKPGECWYADFDLPHSVCNQGDSDRIHLVIDGIRNHWSDDLFTRAGYDFSKEQATLYAPETVLRMIEELDHMDTETARALAADLKRQHGIS